MSPSSEPNGQLGNLIDNPGFRMAMRDALKSKSSLPRLVLQSLVNDGHFKSIFLEAIGLWGEEELPETLKQEHFTKLADDTRIQFLLKDLLESHLRFRDRLRATGRWLLFTFKAWAEKALGVKLGGGSGSNSGTSSADAGGYQPYPASAGKSSIVTLITTLLLGGGAVLAYSARSEIRDFKSEYHQNQRTDNSYLSVAYWHELHELEERTRKDIKSDFNSFSSQIDSKMNLIASKQSSDTDKKTKEDIIRTVREDVHKSVNSELTERYDKRLTAIESSIPAGFYWAGFAGCPSNNKGAVSAVGYAPAWANCCCNHEGGEAVATEPPKTPIAPTVDKQQDPTPVDVATFRRLDTESADQKLGSQLSSSVLFSAKRVITVLYPVSSRGYEACTITLDVHPTKDKAQAKVDAGIDGKINCVSPRLAELNRSSGFYIPYRLAKKWIFYPQVLAFVRIDPVRGGPFNLQQQGWRVSVQAGSYALPPSKGDQDAEGQKRAGR
jgi:hypothetical protein